MNNLLSVALATNSYIPNLERSAVQMYYTNRTFAFVSFLGQVLMVFLILCCLKYFVGHYFKKEEKQVEKEVKVPKKVEEPKEIKVVEKMPIYNTTTEEVAKKEVVNQSQDIVDEEEIPENIIPMKKEDNDIIKEEKKIAVGEFPESAPIAAKVINEDFDEEAWLQEVKDFQV